jgi:hypothetical protein
MVKFCFVDQDSFELDVVRYAPGLGDEGIAVYRKEVAAKSTGSDRFAARYAAERLAILDRDVDALVVMLGGDLSSSYQYQRVAEAMVELDLPDEVLRWARDGIERTSGWQVAKLYDLAAELLSDRGEVARAVGCRKPGIASLLWAGVPSNSRTKSSSGSTASAMRRSVRQSDTSICWLKKECTSVNRSPANCAASSESFASAWTVAAFGSRTSSHQGDGSWC